MKQIIHLDPRYSCQAAREIVAEYKQRGIELIVIFTTFPQEA